MKNKINLKWISFAFCVMLFIVLLPAAAYAFTDGFGDNYDENEYQQLKTFLNLDSASPFDYSNGREMSYMYDENDPSHWYHVTWAPYTEGSDTVYHVTAIDWKTSGSFYSLNGDLDLSNFDHLQSFKTQYCQIDSLNVANDAELTTLECINTQLTDYDGNIEHVGVTALDVSTNVALTYLDCSKNGLTVLDVSHNPLLETLICSENHLTALDLTSNSALTNVQCSYNEITSLNTSAAGTNLSYLYCENNDISTLNINGNTNLVKLVFNGNQVGGTLDLTDHALLEKLECDNNQLTALVTDGCSSLEELKCDGNQISALDVSDSTPLNTLYCRGNSLTALDVSNNAALGVLDCGENRIPSLAVGSNTNLAALYCDGNLLTSLDVSKNALLVGLICSDNDIAALDVTQNTALTNLVCGGNALSAIDVFHNTLLTELDCSDNLLTALDVTTNTNLTTLTCGGNNLGTLDVTQNTALQTLDCGDAGLSTLDLSQNTTLYTLICNDNQFTTLDLTHNTSLNGLDCSGNLFTTLDVGDLFLIFLNSTDNPLTYVKAGIPYDWGEDPMDAELTANGEGYVGLYFSWFEDELYAQATPKSGYTLKNWTDEENAQVSTSAQYTLQYETAYDLTANFSATSTGGGGSTMQVRLTSSSPDGTTFPGGTIALTPNINGGTWSWDPVFFSASLGNPAVFTALKAGTSTITYTVAGLSVSYNVTVKDVNLPKTGQDGMLLLFEGAALCLTAIGIGFGACRRQKRQRV